MTCQIYLITPPRFDVTNFQHSLTQALQSGDVACVQLRLKDPDGGPAPQDEVRAVAKILMPLVQAQDVAFIINDDAELSAELGADGVHVGQKDITAKAARAIVGPKAIVGVTCRDSRHLAIDAAEAGADYVAFGAFYPTTTKSTKFRPEPDILEIWTNTTNVPCVAIGGITVHNALPLIEAGANFIAIVSAVWDHPKGPATAIREFKALMDKTLKT